MSWKSSFFARSLTRRNISTIRLLAARSQARYARQLSFQHTYISGSWVSLGLRAEKKEYKNRCSVERRTSPLRDIMASSSKNGDCSFGRKHRDILRALYHFNTEQRTALLRKADSKLVKHICECSLNILHRSISLNKRQRTRLRKHAIQLRQLANPNKQLSSKKKSLYKKEVVF